MAINRRQGLEGRGREGEGAGERGRRRGLNSVEGSAAVTAFASGMRMLIVVRLG